MSERKSPYRVEPEGDHFAIGYEYNGAFMAREFADTKEEADEICEMMNAIHDQELPTKD